MHGDPGVGPSAAERARTTLTCAPTLTIEVDGRVEMVDLWAVRPDGLLVFPLPAAADLSARVADGPAAGLVHGARLSPLEVPDRVLDAVQLHGTVGLVDGGALGAALTLLGDAHPERLAELLRSVDPAVVLQVAVERIRLGGVAVDPDAYSRAVVDPLAVDSDEVILHLLQDHEFELGQLAHLLDPALLRTTRLLAPVAVDRYGLTFRLAGDHGVALARLNYPAALRGPAELSVALRKLRRRAAQVACRCCARPNAARSE